MSVLFKCLIIMLISYYLSVILMLCNGAKNNIVIALPFPRCMRLPHCAHIARLSSV